jgi:hypothetical protein
LKTTRTIREKIRLDERLSKVRHSRRSGGQAVEVRLLEGRRIGLAGEPLGEDPPPAQDDPAVGELESLAEVVGHHDDRPAPLA